MRNLETIVFDADGTLFNTKNLIIDIGKEVIGKDATDEEIKDYMENHAEEVIKVIFGFKSFWKLPIVLAKGRKLYYERIHEVEPYDGMVDIVKDLSRDYEILILSSNSKKTIYDVLHSWDLKCNGVYHSIRLFGLSALFGKHLELEKIKKERGWKKDETGKMIYVGDEVRDFHACQKADVEMFGVTWGLNTARALTYAGLPLDNVVSDPYDLPKKIREYDLEIIQEQP